MISNGSVGTPISPKGTATLGGERRGDARKKKETCARRLVVAARFCNRVIKDTTIIAKAGCPEQSRPRPNGQQAQIIFRKKLHPLSALLPVAWLDAIVACGFIRCTAIPAGVLH
jgi:hypothetical protein